MPLATTIAPRNTTLLATIAPRGGLLQALVCVVLGSLLLTASAKVQVPFWPVPMTMQTLAVMVIGMAYGSRLAGATVLLYLAQGVAGLPVFAGPAPGYTYIMGPTAGYLVGFAVVLALGVAWLSVQFGAEKAYAVGLAPFWAATLLKTLLGAAVMQAAWRVVERRSAAS